MLLALLACVLANLVRGLLLSNRRPSRLARGMAKLGVLCLGFFAGEVSMGRGDRPESSPKHFPGVRLVRSFFMKRCCATVEELLCLCP